MKKYFSFVKFEHSIFALPFAFSGALLNSTLNFTVEIKTFILIFLAMVCARSFAMSVNRIIDKDIDLKNPRTSEREIPKGEIKIKSAVIFAITSIVILFFIVLNLPRICLYLVPLAVVWFLIYPYTKRFTFLCHIWLGVALGGSVLGGFLAGGGSIISLSPYILALAVVFWTAGFDIIYACQDFEFDKLNNLQSIPTKFGIKNALLISRVFHLITILFLIYLGILNNFSIIYFMGVTFVSAVLFYEQSLVKENDLSKVNLAFFTLNGWVSVGFFLFFYLAQVKLAPPVF